MLLKEVLNKVSHENRLEGLEELLSNKNEVGQGLIQGRFLTKILRINGYMIERGESSNLMDRKKELPIEETPTKKQKDYGYWPKLIHGWKVTCDTYIDDKVQAQTLIPMVCTYPLLFQGILGFMMALFRC